MIALRWALSLAFVLLLPLLIIGSNLRLLVFDRGLILSTFREAQVGRTTGLDEPQLARVAEAFVAYFRAPPGRLDVQVQLDGRTRPLFNERELLHMEDVQALVHLFLRLQVVAAVVVAARVAVAILVERSGRDLGRDMLVSSLLVVGLVVVIGSLALVDFPGLWTRFHQVAFRNDLWLLDPRSDYLIMLFPQPTWFTYTVRMVGGVASMTLLTGAVGFLAWRFAP